MRPRLQASAENGGVVDKFKIFIIRWKLEVCSTLCASTQSDTKKAAIKAAFVYAGNGVAYIMVASGKDFKFFFYLNT